MLIHETDAKSETKSEAKPEVKHVFQEAIRVLQWSEERIWMTSLYVDYLETHHDYKEAMIAFKSLIQSYDEERPE